MKTKHAGLSIRELSNDQITRILNFCDRPEQKDYVCNAWISICAAAADGHAVLSDDELDYLYNLKFKYGEKILHRIAEMKK